MNRDVPEGKQGRRQFLCCSTLLATGTVAAGAATAQASPSGALNETSRAPTRLPREVVIGTVAQEGLSASTPAQMAEQLIGRMQQAAAMKPDVICLPELCAFTNLNKPAPKVVECAEEGIGPILEKFSKFARDHHCYVVCPTYTRHHGKCYNAAVFLNREGNIVGEYHKSYPTTSEMREGVYPGTLQPSVIETDFGKVGAQICFDIQWDAGWRCLRDAGAEIVFWPSAFSGGKMVCTRAWQNRYSVVASTNKDVSKVCDFTGEELAVTSRWHPWVCATVNLEKAFLHTWPYVGRFDEIVSKYGPKIRIYSFAFEEWSIIESRDPEVKIADVMKEFELLTIDQHLKTAEREHAKLRA